VLKEQEDGAIQTLDGIALEQIVDAFNDAFSGYALKFSMTEEKLAEMFAARSHDAGLSLGYFVDGVPTGFALIGRRGVTPSARRYVISMGVRSSAQGQGIAQKLMTAIVADFRASAAKRLSLEVLEQNHRAKRLYEAAGMQVTRRLLCFEIDRTTLSASATETATPSLLVSSIEVDTYCTFRPTWQNAVDAVDIVGDKLACVVSGKTGTPDAYAIVHRKEGTVLQLGLAPEHRNTDVLRRILGAVATVTNAPSIRYLNVEDGSKMHALLLEIGARNFVCQWEMRLG
jgi:ribosomal protein S18 acetylase RimI-like enzyme